jgi:hypothetical protein
MNKLILIGNGFDLAHGLKTKYEDFILWYLNKKFEMLQNTPGYLYEDGLIKVEDYRRFQPKEFHSAKEFLDYMKLYKVKITYTHSFIENIITHSSQFNWVDIESKYYESLLNLFHRLAKADSNYIIYASLNKLNTCFDLLKKELIEYLSTVDNKLNSKNEEINSHLFEEIDNILAINGQRGTFHEILILNFNYTSTINLYLKEASGWPCKINYVHGKLNDKNNPIIFGYGDEMDTYYEQIERLNSNAFLKNIKSFGYFKTNNYQNFTQFMNSGKFNVYIMGHSCGLSDRILLNSIFENENCQKVKLYYYQISESENDFFEKTQEISRHYRAANKGKMRNMIVPFSQSVPLTKF